MSDAKQQPVTGFFLPTDLFVELIEVLDELPHKRVKKISRRMEVLGTLTGTPIPEEAPPAQQPPSPASPEGAGPSGSETVAPVTPIKQKG